MAEIFVSCSVDLSGMTLKRSEFTDARTKTGILKADDKKLRKLVNDYCDRVDDKLDEIDDMVCDDRTKQEQCERLVRRVKKTFSLFVAVQGEKSKLYRQFNDFNNTVRDYRPGGTRL